MCLKYSHDFAIFIDELRYDGLIKTKAINNFYETFPMCEGVTMLSVVSKGIPLISLFEKLKGIINPSEVRCLEAYFLGPLLTNLYSKAPYLLKNLM